MRLILLAFLFVFVVLSVMVLFFIFKTAKSIKKCYIHDNTDKEKLHKEVIKNLVASAIFFVLWAVFGVMYIL